MVTETKEPLLERELQINSFEKLEGRKNKRALALSVVPGLGQIYNGEIVKGSLFLAVTLANLSLLSLLFFTTPMLNATIQFATIFLHRVPKFEVQRVAEIVQSGGSVTFTYLALIAMFAVYAARDAHDRSIEKQVGKTFPRVALSLSEATSGSYLVHVSIIATLILMIIFFGTPPQVHRQVTNITFKLAETEPPPKKTAPPKAQQAPKKPDEPIKEPPKPEKPPEPVKPTPVAVAVPTDKPVADPVVQSNEPAPVAAPTPPASSSDSGSAQGSPTGTPGQEASGDGDDVDFGNYLSEIQKRIKKNWVPPRNTDSLTATLKFQILKDGSLGSIKLKKSSGSMAYDDACKLALSSAAPFPPLPKGAGDDVDINFTFDYSVFSGKH